MTAFSVDTVALGERISEMDSFDKTLQEQLDSLDQAITRLHVTWEGEAAAAHRTAHAEWRDGAEDMRKAVAAMRAAAQIARGNYERAVDANVKMWGSVQ